MNHLVHLRNNGADIAKIGLYLASAQVLRQGGLKFGLMRPNGVPELFELLNSPLDRKGGAGAEEFALGLHYGANLTFGELGGIFRCRGCNGLQDLFDLVFSHGYLRII